uniref:C2H2-type domain-containing protein n=1 Tax=Oryza punctata TaxID=4537 RepID=A0A0E0M1C7_ORYPU
MAARLAAAGGHPATPATPALPWPQGDLLPAREYAWRSTPWEEQAHAHGALAAPRSGDQEITPWWRRSPSAVTIPVYPHVERSPSPPIARGWPADDDERQERGEPSGSPAMAPPVQPAPHVEQFTPVAIKEPAAEAVCVPSGSPGMAPPVQPAPHVEQSTPLLAKEPAAVALAVVKVEADAVVHTGANADADQALLGKGATPGGQGCIGQEGEDGDIAIDGHGRQLVGEMNVSKSTEQPKPIESISGGQTSELIQKRYQDNKLADQEIATLDDKKQIGSNDEELCVESLKNYISLHCVYFYRQIELTPERRSSGVKRQLASGASPAKKPRSQGSSITCSLCKVTITSPRALVEHRASLLHRSNLAPLRSGNKATTEAAQPAEKKTEKPQTPEWNSSAHHHQSLMYYCGICEVRCSSEKTMASHLAGKRHRERHNSIFM